MAQIKTTDIPRVQFLTTAGESSLDIARVDIEGSTTFYQIEAEKKVTIKVPYNPDLDYTVQLRDGNLTRVCTVTINGIQWVIPVEIPFKVPLSVFEVLKHSSYQAQMLSSEQQRQVPQGGVSGYLPYERI
jgi:hypothetical protein